MNDSFKKHTLTDVLIDIQIRLHAAPHAISYHQFRFLIDLNFVAENWYFIKKNKWKWLKTQTFFQKKKIKNKKKLLKKVLVNIK